MASAVPSTRVWTRAVHAAAEVSRWMSLAVAVARRCRHRDSAAMTLRYCQWYDSDVCLVCEADHGGLVRWLTSVRVKDWLFALTTLPWLLPSRVGLLDMSVFVGWMACCVIHDLEQVDSCGVCGGTNECAAVVTLLLVALDESNAINVNDTDVARLLGISPADVSSLLVTVGANSSVMTRDGCARVGHV